jgi:hypothetical protein
MKTRIMLIGGLASAAAIGGLAVGGLALSSAGASPATHIGWATAAQAAHARDAAAAAPAPAGAMTIKLHEVDTNGANVDTGAKGPSIGDYFDFEANLFNRGTTQRAGTLAVHCEGFFTRSLCHGTAALGAGRISFEGSIPNSPEFTIPVTGGDGAYVQARGQIHIFNQQPNNTNDVDIELVG